MKPGSGGTGRNEGEIAPEVSPKTRWPRRAVYVARVDTDGDSAKIVVGADYQVASRLTPTPASKATPATDPGGGSSAGAAGVSSPSSGANGGSAAQSGTPRPRPKRDRTEDGAAGSYAESATDRWLRENVPPHW